jgi:hypothetical protein
MVRAPITLARLGSQKGNLQDGTEAEPCRGASPAMDCGIACPVGRRSGFRRTSPRRRAGLYRLPQQSRRANAISVVSPRGGVSALRSDWCGDEPGRRDQSESRFPTVMEPGDRLRRTARVVPEHPVTSSTSSTSTASSTRTATSSTVIWVNHVACQRDQARQCRSRSVRPRKVVRSGRKAIR